MTQYVQPASPPPAWLAAVDLFRYLNSGQVLRPIPTALRFGEEPIFADTRLTYARYYGMNIAADRHEVSAFGGVLFIAGAFAANAAANANARRKAEKMSAPQWREHAPARTIITDRRTVCLVHGEWLSFPFSEVVELNVDLQNAACVTTFGQVEPMLLAGPTAAYYAVMMAYLLYGHDRFSGLPGLAPIVVAAQQPHSLPAPAQSPDAIQHHATGAVIAGEIV